MKSSEDFRRVRERGVRARRDGLTVFVAKARSMQGRGRVGITIPATVGNAVARNRLRRRLRAAVERMDMRRGRDVVVRADSDAAEAPFHELEENLRTALTNANEGLGNE